MFQIKNNLVILMMEKTNLVKKTYIIIFIKKKVFQFYILKN